MKKIKRYTGYINLKPINGVLYPSSIQNILMKNYVVENLKESFIYRQLRFYKQKILLP